MDNVCHTLAGAAFGRAGLASRTRFGTATLMIAANLPDLDVLVFATSTPAVAFRRGWTHGLLAQALLPVGLTALMVLIGRRRSRDQGGPPVSAPWLLVLSCVGVISHVLMDLLNNYGIRLLAPFDWRWFYGDSVFIIDPWLWAMLGGGVLLSRRGAFDAKTRWTAPARAALVLATVYVGAMMVSARLAREHVIDAWRATHGTDPRALMVGPVPVTPLQRAVIVDAGDRYETGTFRWFPARVTFAAAVPKHDTDARVARAKDAPNIRAFLVWSRFPFWIVEESAAGTRVTVSDMRFADRGAAFRQTVILPEPRRPRRSR